MKEYSKKELVYLFDGQAVSPQLDFSFDDSETDELAQNMQNLSISGAQEKYSAVIKNNKIILTPEKEQGTYILKPAPTDKLRDRKEIPANENLTMQIASQVYGIKTARNGICVDSDGNVVYITKRYDVAYGRKLNQEDFASLLGKSEDSNGDNFKYEGSYYDIARCIKSVVSAPIIALEQLFKLIVFNYIYANGDAHLKNFSVIYADNEVMLAPAYDLINTAMHIGGDDIGLKNGFAEDYVKSDVYETTGHPCKDDFFRFGELIGLQPIRIKRILDAFTEFPDKVFELIDKSFLSTDKHRRNYKRIIEERRTRFIRGNCQI